MSLEAEADYAMNGIKVEMVSHESFPSERVDPDSPGRATTPQSEEIILPFDGARLYYYRLDGWL